MYHIIEFDDGTIEVVNSSWVEVDDGSGNVEIAFPPKTAYATIRKLLRSKADPSSTWSCYKVKILKSHESFDEITRKCAKFSRTGSMSTTDDGEQRKRKVQETDRYGFNEPEEPRRKKCALRRSNAGVTHLLPGKSTNDMTTGTSTIHERPCDIDFPEPPFSQLGTSVSQGSVSDDESKEAESNNESVKEVELQFTTSTPIATRGDPNTSSNDNTNLSNMVSEALDFDFKCHCVHVQHWSREVLRILLRLEHRSACICSTMHASIESTEEEPGIDFPTTADEIIEFFNTINENKDIREKAIQTVSKEVCKRKKKSIKRIILRISSPAAWKMFSKKGQRGKKSAMDLQLPRFIADVLRHNKMHNIENQESVDFICRSMGEVLKRMPQMEKRKTLTNILNMGTSRDIPCAVEDDDDE